jgi:hypothetical protein
MLVLNRSAIVVKPKQPFLDWLQRDPEAASPVEGRSWEASTSTQSKTS